MEEMPRDSIVLYDLLITERLLKELQMWVEEAEARQQQLFVR